VAVTENVTVARGYSLVLRLNRDRRPNRNDEQSDGLIVGVGQIDVAGAVGGNTRGKLNRAAVPVPSVDPPTPANPASVLTAPDGEIMRSVSLSVSAT